MTSDRPGQSGKNQPMAAADAPEAPLCAADRVEALLDTMKFTDNGLVGCIVQDARTDEILMFAFMNRESLAHTLRTGKATYWSRSRGKLWVKGESSGHIQRVRELRIDCDADAVVIRVDQIGGACHEGYQSCFFRKVEDGQWAIDREKVFDESSVYKKAS